MICDTLFFDLIAQPLVQNENVKKNCNKNYWLKKWIHVVIILTKLKMFLLIISVLFNVVENRSHEKPLKIRPLMQQLMTEYYLFNHYEATTAISKM